MALALRLKILNTALIVGDLTPLQSRLRQKLKEEIKFLKKQGILKLFKYINNHVTLVDEEPAGSFGDGRSDADHSSASQDPRARTTSASIVGRLLHSNDSDGDLMASLCHFQNFLY